MALNLFDPRQRADLRRVSSGNWAQKIAGGLGQFASGIGINRDFGVSEMFGTPTPQAAEPASSFGPNNPANFPPTPNEWQRLGYSSEEEYQQYLANGYTGSKSGYTNWLKDQASKSVAGGGGGGAAYEPNNANVGDRVFDLNDPGQLQDYINTVNDKLNGDFEYYASRSSQAKELDIAQAKADEEEAIYNIDRALKKLGESRDQYTEDYTRSVADLAEGFRQGTAKRQSFYASVAPRVYQSSQGTSQEYAKGKYVEGQGRYESDKARAMNAFADTEQDYGRSREGTINKFNLFKTQREAQSTDEIAEKARSVEEMRGQARAKTLNYTDSLRNAGVSSNKFATPTFSATDLSGYSPANVNLNDLMQFIKFQPAGAATGSTNAYRTSAIATPESGGESLGNYMGYQQEPTEPSTINAYKKGYGLY